jgi:cyclin G-associated kinase
MITLEDKPIGFASDIWMLGCIAYFMYFRKHPFEGEGKLAIISPNVKYPEDSKYTKLIQSLLMLDPAARPTAVAVKERVMQLQQQL